VALALEHRVSLNVKGKATDNTKPTPLNGGCGLISIIGWTYMNMIDELKLSIITDEYEYSEWIINANC